MHSGKTDRYIELPFASFFNKLTLIVTFFGAAEHRLLEKPNRSTVQIAYLLWHSSNRV